MRPIQGWGILNVIISLYKKLAATTPPQVYSIIVHKDNRYNAATLFCLKGYKPVSIVEKLAFLYVHIKTSSKYCDQLMFIFVPCLYTFLNQLVH